MKLNNQYLLIPCLLIFLACAGKQIKPINSKKESESHQTIAKQQSSLVGKKICSDVSKIPDTYFHVTARLIDYVEKYPWFAFWDGTDYDGEAPYGKFKVIYPESERGKEIGIIFMYEFDCNFKAEKFLGESVQGIFKFAVPKDFMTSGKIDLDDDLVLALERIK